MSARGRVELERAMVTAVVPTFARLVGAEHAAVIADELAMSYRLDVAIARCSPLETARTAVDHRYHFRKGYSWPSLTSDERSALAQTLADAWFVAGGPRIRDFDRAGRDREEEPHHEQDDEERCALARNALGLDE